MAPVFVYLEKDDIVIDAKNVRKVEQWIHITRIYFKDELEDDGNIITSHSPKEIYTLLTEALKDK